jgi:hypothetical protein
MNHGLTDEEQRAVDEAANNAGTIAISGTALVLMLIAIATALIIVLVAR